MLSLILAAAIGLFGQPTQVELGKRMLQAEQWDQARAAFQQAVQADPRNGEAHYYLAQLYARQKDDRNTVTHFREALSILPDQLIIWSEYGDWLLTNGYFDEAERAFRKLAEDSPDNSEYWRKLGLSLYQGGNPTEALLAYAESIKLDPRFAQTYYLAGVSARSMSRLKQAEDFFTEGLAVDPDHEELNLQMGELRLQDGALEESLAFLQKLDESHLAANYNRGVVYLRLNQLNDAERLLRQVVRESPEHTRAHYQLGRLYSRKQEKELAEKFFQHFRVLEQRDRERSRISEKKSIVEKSGLK